MNKKTHLENYLKNSLFKIENLLKIIVKSDEIEEKDFNVIESILYSIENDSLIIKDDNVSKFSLELINVFKSIRNKSIKFKDVKYDIISFLSLLKHLFHSSLEENMSFSLDDYDKVKNINQRLSDILEKNKNKNNYYYIKIYLNKDEPLFFLTRKVLIEYLNKIGQVFNYTPYDLEDEVYDYMIINFYSLESENYIIDKLKEFNDVAIKEFKILPLDNEKNVYKIRFFYSSVKRETPQKILDNFTIIDTMCFQNEVDLYAVSNNEIDIFAKLSQYEEDDLSFIMFKHYSDNDVKIFTKNINKKNIINFKNQIMRIREKQSIKEILYGTSPNFYLFQFLEFLRQNYFIDHGGY